jgi:hypothetical protein
MLQTVNVVLNLAAFEFQIQCGIALDINIDINVSVILVLPVDIVVGIHLEELGVDLFDGTVEENRGGAGVGNDFPG